MVDLLVINGVDVTSYVNDHDPWHRLHGMLRRTDLAGLGTALDALDAAWAETIMRARSLTEAQLRQSEGDEWPFIETQQHLVFGVDKWFVGPLLGATTFQTAGLANTGSRDFGWIGVDADARLPSMTCLPFATNRQRSFARFHERHVCWRPYPRGQAARKRNRAAD